MTVSTALLIPDTPFGGATTVDDDPRADLRVAIPVILTFFVGFLGWALLTPLDAGAYGRGAVEVAGNRQAVQHREGGTISALYVADGSFVRQGQPLLRIENGDIRAEERGLASEYVMLTAQSARLQGEQAGAATIVMPAEFASLPDDDHELAAQAMATQRRVLSVRRSATSGQLAIIDQRAAQSRAQISGYDQQRRANREQRATIVDELAGLRSLATKGYVTKTRLNTLERAASGLDGDFGSQGADIAKLHEQIGEQRLQGVVLGRDTQKEVDSDLRDVTLRLNELRPKLAAARERLSRTVLRAPATGRVVGQAVFTVGGVVAPGQTVMEVIPQNRELVIKVRISPDDADDVSAGMATQVRFPTLHDRKAPALIGTLASFSADSLTDERSGVHYFEGIVRVSQSEMRKLSGERGGVSPIRPGLPAEILIPLAKRTVFQYLMEPLTQSLWRTGREH